MTTFERVREAVRGLKAGESPSHTAYLYGLVNARIAVDCARFS